MIILQKYKNTSLLLLQGHLLFHCSRLTPVYTLKCYAYILFGLLSRLLVSLMREKGRLSRKTKAPTPTDKNETNHPISSNSHPSATTNKAIYSLKIGGGGQNQREHHIILTKYEAVIRYANNLDNKPNPKPKRNVKTQKRHQKISITQPLRTDLGQSVRGTIATKLAWLNRFKGSQPSH